MLRCNLITDKIMTENISLRRPVYHQPRAVAADHDANIVSVSQREFTNSILPKGRTRPDEIWASQSSTLVEVASLRPISSDQIAAIGITNQRETAIVWERGETGKTDITPLSGSAVVPPIFEQL